MSQSSQNGSNSGVMNAYEVLLYDAERIAAKVEAVCEPPLTREEARTLVRAFRWLSKLGSEEAQP